MTSQRSIARYFFARPAAFRVPVSSPHGCSGLRTFPRGLETYTHSALVTAPDRLPRAQPATGARVRCFWWTAAPSTSAPTRKSGRLTSQMTSQPPAVYMASFTLSYISAAPSAGFECRLSAAYRFLSVFDSSVSAGSVLLGRGWGSFSRQSVDMK